MISLTIHALPQHGPARHLNHENSIVSLGGLVGGAMVLRGTSIIIANQVKDADVIET